MKLMHELTSLSKDCADDFSQIVAMNLFGATLMLSGYTGDF